MPIFISQAMSLSDAFYAFLMLFMASMVGISMSDNLILLWLFWELTSLSSFLLIGFWSYRSDARKGARMALTVTGAGGLALLAGLLLLGDMAGSYRMDDVLASGAVIVADPLYPLMLGLVLLGAFTKSAQFPFQFWLPHAMAAPHACLCLPALCHHGKSRYFPDGSPASRHCRQRAMERGRSAGGYHHPALRRLVCAV